MAEVDGTAIRGAWLHRSRNGPIHADRSEPDSGIVVRDRRWIHGWGDRGSWSLLARVDGGLAMSKRRFHPERMLMFVLVVLLAATWGCGLAALFLDKPELYRWAGWALGVGIAVSSIPLFGYLLCRAIEKIRRRTRRTGSDSKYGSSGRRVCCGKDPLKTGAEPSARARQKGPAPTTFAIASTPGNAGRGPMRRRRRKGLREAIFHIFGNPDYQMSYGEHTLLPDEP